VNTLVYPLLLIVPLAILAWRWHIYPHRPLVYLAAVPAALSLALVFGARAMLWPLAGLDAVLAVVAIVDLWSLPRAADFAIERQVGRIASLGKTHRVTLTIVNASRRDRVVSIRDDAAVDLRPEPDRFTIRLAARSRVTLGYDLRPRRRGAFALELVYLRAGSRLGLWQRHLRYPAASVVHVYPDLKQVGEYAVLARTNRLSLMGVRRMRRIGADNEFERLRDFTPDDNYKHIDWRSTARRQKLTVKDFQSNHSQRIVFLVDCGRMMTNEAGGVSLLDHALNATLMLAFVALRQGDSVGMMAFSDEIHAYVPPRGGASQVNALLHASFDRFPRLVESRYDQAFLYLATHCRKRALVVLVTNVIDEVNARQIHQYLGNLVGRHLPLGVLLRDHRLFDAADVEHPSGKALYRAAAAADILSWRHQVLRDLVGRGVLTVDAFPEDLTAGLVNRYLEVKARHLL
jgi:uncharacterized protein (DUF58 family)